MDSCSEGTDDEQLDVGTLRDARALLQGAGIKRGAAAAAVSSPLSKPPSKVQREDGEESGATVTEQVEALERAPLTRDQRGGRLLSYTGEDSEMSPKPMLKVAGAVPVSSARAMCPVRCSVGLGIGLGF